MGELRCAVDGYEEADFTFIGTGFRYVDMEIPDGVMLEPLPGFALSDSLWAVSTIAVDLPAGLIEDAQNAFISGFNGAAIFSAISVTILGILAAVMLRHIEPLGPSE